MKIIIHNETTPIDKVFLKRLCNKLLFLYPRFVSSKRLKVYDEYLKEKVFTKRGRTFTAKQVLTMGLRNLRISISNQESVIDINPNLTVPYYDDLKIVAVCNLINNGNLDIKGTKVLTKLFSYVVDNIQALRTEFEMGLL